MELYCLSLGFIFVTKKNLSCIWLVLKLVKNDSSLLFFSALSPCYSQAVNASLLSSLAKISFQGFGPFVTLH